MAKSNPAIDLTLDYHAHILPRCDHGSDGVETSLRQLAMAADVGIRTVCATPHFYPHRENAAAFLERRARCAAALPRRPELPRILLGAEVLICDGMERLDDLPRLCLEGTNELLLEMPFYAWPSSLWDTLFALCERRDIRIVLAHADRYPKENIERLIREGIPLQLNAVCLTKPIKRRRYLEWIQNGYVKYLGSDIHMLGDGYPFGSNNQFVLYGGQTYAHNFWLDIYRVAGILPFIFSISATIDEIIILFRFGRLHTDRSISPIAFCFTSAAIINFMVEPIYIANPYIYYFFLMIQGGINGAMHQSKSEVTP